MLAVLDVAVRQAQQQHGLLDARLGQHLQAGAAGTAHHHVLFHRHEGVMRGRQLADQVSIDGLDEAHVDHRGIQRLAGRHGGRHHRPEGQDGNALALAPHLGLAARQFGKFLLHRHARARAARIAHGHRRVVAHG